MAVSGTAAPTGRASADRSEPRPGSKRVPCKPTSHMLAAGARAGRVVPDIAWRIYRAMLDAAGFDSPETVFADGVGSVRD